MSWIEQLESKFRDTPMHVVEKRYDKSGCILNFDSLPIGSVVIDVDAFVENDDQIRGIVGRDTRCDVAIFGLHRGEASVVLIEATTDRTKMSRKMREAIDQIASSFNHLESLIGDCGIPIPEMNRYAVVASKRVSPNSINNEPARRQREEFEAAHRAEVRYVRCGRDIWQEIQGGDLNHH